MKHNCLTLKHSCSVVSRPPENRCGHARRALNAQPRPPPEPSPSATRHQSRRFHVQIKYPRSLECHVCLCASLAGRRFVPLLPVWAAAERSALHAHTHTHTHNKKEKLLSAVLGAERAAARSETTHTPIGDRSAISLCQH